MSDLRSVFVDLDRGADLALEGFDLAVDDGLETAVILSLFSDARARDDDRLPPGHVDRRGWWADAYLPDENDEFGSRLWLLRSSKQLQASLNEAQQIAEEALAWLVADGVASKVEVEMFIPRDEVMGMRVRIHRPDGAQVPYRFETLWNEM